MESIHKPQLVMIDDDPVFLKGYHNLLQDQYQVFEALTISEGIKIIEAQHPEVLLLDIALKREKEGLEVLPILRDRFPELKIVVVTNQDSHLIAKEALSRGAHEYFVKSDQLIVLRMILENLLVENDITNHCNSFSVGKLEMMLVSSVMKDLFHQLKHFAATDFSILITGKSGVGKELAARFLHEHSDRKDKPFIAVNCAALPDTLFINEMFGHEQGAYTDARNVQIGKLIQANGGTLFLDEIGFLSRDSQAALLRVLEEKRFQSLGSSRFLDVDVRFLAATSANLKEKLQNGEFLSELYYRIADEEIRIPPLREREDDILPLANFFLKEIQEKEKIGKKRFTDQTLLVLKSYHWPGNIRELRKVIRRAVIRSYGRPNIRVDDLGIFDDATNRHLPYEYAREQALREFQRAYFKPLIVKNNGNLSAVAEAAGISRQGLHKILKELRLDL